MKLKIALLLTLASVGFHLYLTYHYYGLNFGFAAGDALCNLSAKFDCDTVTASPFSALFGVPMALWGAVTNGMLALMLIGSLIGWNDDSERHDALTAALAAFIAATSVVMGAISTFAVASFCIFCIATYLLSFATAWLVYKSQSSTRRPILDYLLEIPKKATTYLFFIVAIPALGFGAHYSYSSKFGGSQIKAIAKESIRMWQAAPVVNLDTPASLVRGPENAKMVISEFADFLCGHCKNAGPTIKAFVKANPDVRFQFFSFPLDGKCNSAISRSVESPCYLAKSVYCAEKIAQKGWAFHDGIFAVQEKIMTNPNIQTAKEQVEKISQNEQVDFAALNLCVEAEETDAAIRAQAKKGEEAQIRGTPAIFVNGKLLERGQLIQVLDAAKNAL